MTAAQARTLGADPYRVGGGLRTGLPPLLGALACVMVVAAAGCAHPVDRPVTGGPAVARPLDTDTPPRLPVCSGWGCSSSREVLIPKGQWQAIGRLFAPPAGSAELERRRIAEAIARLEQLTAPLAGTAGDLPGNARDRTLRGQMDCVDESRNSTTYLAALEAQGWLRWHHTTARARRSWFVFDQHYTAVIEERDGGAAYAVDSWVGPNGALPEIQPLHDWYLKRHPRPRPARRR